MQRMVTLNSAQVSKDSAERYMERVFRTGAMLRHVEYAVERGH